MTIACGVIQTLFEKHATFNRIGLIVDNEFVNPTSPVEDQWETLKLQDPAVPYKLSSSYRPPEWLDVSHDEVQWLCRVNLISGLLVT
jgi:hypothetical protein